MIFSASLLAVSNAGGRVSAHVRQPAGRLVAHAQDWFERFRSQLGFYRISTIFLALVRRDRLPLSHECKDGGGRLPATWGFVLAAYGRLALVSRWTVAGSGVRPGLLPYRTPDPAAYQMGAQTGRRPSS